MQNNFSWPSFDKENTTHQALKAFLILDVQYNCVRAKNILSNVEQIVCGKLSHFECGGNAYFCDINSDGAKLEVTVDDVDDIELSIIPLKEFTEALRAWLAVCAM